MDAPLGSVEFEESDELDRLRRRAYGPDADIGGDPAAQARLSVLEATRRRPLIPVIAAAGVPVPVPERLPVPGPGEGSRSASTSGAQPVGGELVERELAAGLGSLQGLPTGPVADADSTDGASPAPWWRRHRWWAIVGAAIMVLALNTAFIGWMSRLIAEESALVPADTSTVLSPPLPAGRGHGDYVPSPDYVLPLSTVGADVDRPNDKHDTLDALGISASDLRRYEDFRAPGAFLLLNVWSGESRQGMTCLLVAIPVQGLREGYGGEGCSLEGLDTIVDLPRRGGGGLIRFVLKGDRVNVYLYEEHADPNASHG
ncbi:hypothetical protein [Microbacterium sp. SS28]|uniref:hypothetical protein n=1 Tax=Microbacterium sp. SS28 TaxID=2919948 RepID=UPI001FAAE47A|nr:hypothetical protein [Microbacterium sp. SS28]